MALALVVETSFGSFDMHIKSFGDYFETVSPCVLKNPIVALPIFAESLSITSVTFYESFLKRLVVAAAHHRPSEVREYLSRTKPEDALRLKDADLKHLIRAAIGRLSSKSNGAKTDTLFRALFDIPAWQSEEARTTIMDLVRLRNIFVHDGSTVTADEAREIKRPGLFSTKTYGNLPTIYRVEYPQALALLKDALQEMKNQSDYIRRELEGRPVWSDGQRQGA